MIGESAVIPGDAGFFLLIELLRPVFTQYIHDKRCRGQCTGFVVFQGAETEGLTLSTGLYKLPGNPDHTVLKVHAIPCQPQKLAGSHAREDSNLDECFIFVPLDAFQQRDQLRRVQRMNFRLRDAGKDTCAGRILLDVADSHGDIQCLVKTAMDIFDGLRTQSFCQLLIIQALDCRRFQAREAYCSQGGYDMNPKGHFIVDSRS